MIDTTVKVADKLVGEYDIIPNPWIKEFYNENQELVSVKFHGVTKIRSYAFSGCTNLALRSLSEGLTSIGEYAFQDCTSLALTSLPESLTSIESAAFYSCTSLTSIAFKGTPTTIDSTAFSGCTNLTEIKVPWSEGAVSGAPWGATNATITYNYTE